MNLTTAIDARNPFPGLRPFREDEEHLFFGRENQVDAMVNKLGHTHFLAVVGTSGSGKSSLVNCGLVPGLHGGLMASGGTDWRVAQFRPGNDPIGAMARGLAKDRVLFHDFQSDGLPLSEIIDTTLRMSKLGLVDMFKQSNLPENTNLLVIVDQFEELFRYQRQGDKSDEKVHQEAVEFVNLLLEAAEQTQYAIYVVLTMRSDFLGDCAQFRGLVEAINEGQYLVPRMTRQERRAAIAGPVAVGGAQISPVLLTRLVNDVGDNPDQLSILQHALNRTWAHWENKCGGKGPIDLPHYKAIGTMAHALDQHAERAFSEVKTDRLQQTCKKVFQALTDKATDPRGTRRPTTMKTLCALADATPSEVKQVIEVFRKPSRSFLMPPVGEALDPDRMVDISHESLMRVWKRLDRWANEEARSASWYTRLSQAAALHKNGKTSLWTNPELQLALDWRDTNQPNETWAHRYHSEFSTAMDFLDESHKQREDEERAKRIRNRIIAGTVLAITILMAAISVVVVNSRSTKLAEQRKIELDKVNQQLISEQNIKRYGTSIQYFTDGRLLEMEGKNAEALKLFKRSKDIQEEFYKNESNATYAEDYSNTLIQIGNVSEDPVERIKSYEESKRIRKHLVDNLSVGSRSHEYDLMLADAIMNIANFKESQLDNLDGDAYNATFHSARTNYEEAQQIREKIRKDAVADQAKAREDEINRGLGNGYHNLHTLYYGIYEKTVNEYLSAEKGSARRDELKALYKQYQKMVEEYCLKAQEKVATSSHQESKYVRASCKITIAVIDKNFPHYFEQAYLDLVEITKSNPREIKYKQALERCITEWQKFGAPGDLVVKQVARFYYGWGLAAEDPVDKLGYLENAATLLEGLTNDTAASELLSEILSNKKQIEDQVRIPAD